MEGGVLMKADVVVRIDTLLAEKGIPKGEFYAACGITSSAYSQWRTGKTMPKISTLETVADYLGVNVEYLLTGLGEKEKKKPITQEGDRLSEKEEQLIKMLRDAPPDLRTAAVAAACAVLRSRQDPG